jgi:exodeoxyribonuclease VII small subunit
MGDSKRSRRGTPKSAAQPEVADGAGDAGPQASLSFEGALEQLEGTVGRLEEGEMPLEEALELFETGIKLSRQCNATLEEAERRIEVLIADRDGADGSWRAEPFDAASIDELEDDEEDFEE